jgi:hypothetical protein
MLHQALCHCLLCRRLTGTTYTTCILVPRSALRIISGTPRRNHFTQESGLKVETSFCGDCGGMLGKTTDDPAFADVFILFAGLLDEDISNFNPDTELWVKYRASWITPIQSAAQAQEFS